MTRREKVLAMCLGGTLSGVAFFTLVNWAVIGPFKSVKQQIAAERERQRNLNEQLKRLTQVEREWQEKWTARTLAADPKEAQRRFREDMHRLLARHGLREPKVSPGTFVKYKNGSVGVPLTVSATGTLKEVLGYLCDFYRRDYLARLDKVRITADQSIVGEVNLPRRRGLVRSTRAPALTKREASIGPDGPELKLTVSAITLVLPKLPGLEHPVMQEITELEDGRLLRKREEYNLILDKNLFMPYQEKPAAVAQDQPVTQPSRPAVPATRPLPPPVDPRPGADQQFVRGTVSLDGEQVAYVVDERQRDQPPRQYHLDEPIDDGTLILIHPQGLVVRVRQPDGRTVDYVYPLGASFRDREELDCEAHPEICEAMQREIIS